MPKTLSLQITTPVAVLLAADNVQWIQVNIMDGLLGIWPGHTALLAATVDAPLEYEDESGHHILSLAGGILQISADTVTIFTPGLREESDGQLAGVDDFPRLTSALLSEITAQSGRMV